MAYPIKYLLLQKSELMYEVAIRGESPSENVEGLRRQVTKLTQLYPPDEILDSVLGFLEDTSGFQETLGKVKINLESLKSSFNEPLFNRTKSLLNHLYYRLQRIQKPDKAEEVALLNKLKSCFESYYAYFSSLSKTEITESTSAAVDETTSDKHDLSALKVAVTCDRGIFNDLSKLKYDGKSCVRSFIEKLEEFRSSKKLSDDKILSSAFEIFTGDALHWFRGNRDNIKDCKDLIFHLKDAFDIVDYDYRMISEIRSRTQGDSESIVVYLSIMQGMFGRLGKAVSEDEKLEVILHNIRPCYSNVLANCPSVTSIDQLRTLCRNFERFKARSDTFKEPPSVTAETLAPEFAYQRSSGKEKDILNNKYKSNPSNKFYTNYNNKVYPNTNPSYNKTFAIDTQKVYCYRCKSDSHTMSQCTAERLIFCFKCGMKNFRTPDCPKCSPKSLESDPKN